MKKFGRIGLLILSLIIVAVMLCGCGYTADKSAADEGVYYKGLSENSEDAAEEAADESANSKSAAKAEQVTSNRKIIEYVNLTVETKTFDKLMNDINATVKQAGGYIESSEIGGNSYYSTDRRTAQLKIRIPKSKQSDFSDFMAKNGNVVNRSVSTEDVTSRYIDTQSRITALNIEKETLEKLLTQSANMTDTLTIYERLTDVIAEIESYQGKLNQMDNLIEYTTFTVYIDEVEKETAVKKQGWFAKTWNGLIDSFSNVGNGISTFFSVLIIAIPYLLIPAVIAVAIILIVRRIKKKKAKKTQT